MIVCKNCKKIVRRVKQLKVGSKIQSEFRSFLHIFAKSAGYAKLVKKLYSSHFWLKLVYQIARFSLDETFRKTSRPVIMRDIETSIHTSLILHTFSPSLLTTSSSRIVYRFRSRGSAELLPIIERASEPTRNHKVVHGEARLRNGSESVGRWDEKE